MKPSAIGAKLDKILHLVQSLSKIANQIQVVTAIALVVTVIISMKSYSVSRDALDKTQRAFLNPTGLEGQTVSFPTKAGVLSFYEVRQLWENSGATPAPVVISYIHYSKMPNNDVSSWKFVTPSSVKFQKGFAGPHSQMSAQSTRIPVKDLATPSNNIVVWGWMAYRDVFPRTEIHVTEFCEQVVSVSQPQNIVNSSSPKPVVPILDPNGEPVLPITVRFGFCARHNCVDESCEDYKLIASKLKQ